MLRVIRQSGYENHCDRVGVARVAAQAQPASTGSGQAYPSKPVRVVIPYPPGGGADAAARLVANHLSQALGQPYVIEHKPGGNTLIGTEAVARSPADGYTLLLTGGSTMSIQPFVFQGNCPTTRCAISRRSRWFRVSRFSWSRRFRCRRHRSPNWSRWCGRSPATTRTPRTAPDCSRTWAWKSSTAPPAWTWCTFRTRGSRPRCPTCFRAAPP